jgi:hypothetical protein
VTWRNRGRGVSSCRTAQGHSDRGRFCLPRKDRVYGRPVTLAPGSTGRSSVAIARMMSCVPQNQPRTTIVAVVSDYVRRTGARRIGGMGIAVLGPVEIDGQNNGLAPRDRVVLSAGWNGALLIGMWVIGLPWRLGRCAPLVGRDRVGGAIPKGESFRRPRAAVGLMPLARAMGRLSPLA